MNKSKSNYLLFPAVMMVLFLMISAQAFAFTPKEIYQKTGPGVVLILASEDVGNASPNALVLAEATFGAVDWASDAQTLGRTIYEVLEEEGASLVREIEVRGSEVII